MRLLARHLTRLVFIVLAVALLAGWLASRASLSASEKTATVMTTTERTLAQADGEDAKKEPQIKTVIQGDGGKGQFTSATLSTAAYEALYNKRADFTEVFTAWEGIQADMQGIKLRTFRYEDYGVPQHPSVVLIASGAAVTKNAAKLQRFLAVTQRGYEYAAQNPADAAEVFMSYPSNRDAFRRRPGRLCM